MLFVDERVYISCHLLKFSGLVLRRPLPVFKVSPQSPSQHVEALLDEEYVVVSHGLPKEALRVLFRVQVPSDEYSELFDLLLDATGLRCDYLLEVLHAR